MDVPLRGAPNTMTVFIFYSIAGDFAGNLDSEVHAWTLMPP
jgi:hypothetical protein